MADSTEDYLRRLERREYKAIPRARIFPRKAGGGLSVLVSRASGQGNPVNTGPINFTVTFNAPATGFTNADISFSGSTVGGTLAAAVTGTGPAYNVAVTGMTGNGLVTVSIPAAAATDATGKPFPASSSASVTFDNVAPTVTINQAVGQPDPTTLSMVNFTAVFSKPVTGFVPADVSLTGTTATGTLAVSVFGSGATYTVAVTGMTGAGNVVASIPAGAATDSAGNTSTASTSTDNTVAFTVASGGAATDDFNRANGSLGSNWGADRGALSIVSNQVKGTASTNCVGFWNAAGAPDDQFAQIVWRGGGNGGGPVVRHDGASPGTYYLAFFNGSTVSISRVGAGSYASLNSASFTPASGDILRLEVAGSTLTAKVNGTTVVTTTDANLPAIASGKPGFEIFDGALALDDWSGSGGAASDPWAALDGRAAAPTGTAQYPTFFAGYVTRPPWKVAGVDYRVGINTGVVLQPITSYPVTTGVDFDAANHLVRVSANNLVFDGYDVDGWGFYISSSNIVIRNCKFHVGGIGGRNDLPSDVSSNITVEYCEFDGTGISPKTYNQYVFPRGNGDFIMRYCFFKNIANHGLEFQGNANAAASSRLLMSYNLFDEFSNHPDCTFGVFAPGDEQHQNWLQMFGSNSTGTRATFNTYKQHVAYSGGQGIQLQGSDCNCTNNSIVTFDTGTNASGTVSGASCVAAIFDPGHSGSNFDGGVLDNYIDRRGCRAVDGFSVFHPDVDDTPRVVCAVSGNIDMVTGLTISRTD